ncbi:hypothetical protein FP364_16240 [Citrobacter amalonaticus]|uniref:hypothetical protein n=1 Tax=Citrobacter amalonaticus TaxID=35703 RepID=UPI001C9556D8|nr:hypothetical protein [Citrobacter amalonaticus]MBY5256422.1 hypothetical protein [Citrobacter amalonaticus]
MSTVDFLENVVLKNIRPGKLISNYDRGTISAGEKEVKLSMQSSYGEDKSDAKKYMIKFSACAEVVEEENHDEVFNVKFETNYFFDILNLEKISDITDEHKTAISAAMVYLDFRSRLQRILADVGLSSVKVPLSPINSVTQE